MIPSSIIVMGDKVRVREDLRRLNTIESGENEILGAAFIVQDLILIRSDLPERAKKKVLLHEACHVAMHKNGIDQFLTKEQQEVLCQMVSQLYFELKRQRI